MVDKYGIVNEWETKITSMPYGCSCWKTILKSLKDFKKGIKVEVGSGAKTKFWKDRWCSSSLLIVEHLNLYRLAKIEG